VEAAEAVKDRSMLKDIISVTMDVPDMAEAVEGAMVVFTNNPALGLALE
jgi:hypothetical protein